jgi:2-haloacid dehalogenase
LALHAPSLKHGFYQAEEGKKPEALISRFSSPRVAFMLSRRGIPMPNPLRKTVLAFDVYGTLIDPLRMEERLRPAFGEKAKEASELWRTKQIEYSFRRALMKKYRNFNVCTAQALQFVSMHVGIPLSEAAHTELLSDYLRLPAFADVPGALGSLAASGFTMVACSNGTEDAVRSLLAGAGVLERFSRIVSVDPIRTFKPDPAVYELLVTEVAVPKESVWLVSSNPFDIIGAKACGLRTAWVQRDPKRIFDPWEFTPDVTVHDLRELSDKITLTEGPR